MLKQSTIRTKIEAGYDNLPKNHKRIADYILDNLDSIPFRSVNELSEATEVSVASIVRFAQRIGFSGFLELRDKIGESLQDRIQSKAIFSLVDENKVDSDTLVSVANQEITNINETFKLIDRREFSSVIDILLKAKRVFTSGLGMSYLLAEILAYQLKQVAVDARNFTHSHSSFLEQSLFLDKNDALIAFSFPPYSKETIKMAKFAKERGVKVIGITNKKAAPITRFSDGYLTVNSENMLFTNSFSAISVMINAIATECAIRNKSKANKILEKRNEIVYLDDILLKDG